VHAQRGEAELILNDGKRIKGFGEITGMSSILTVRFKNDSLKYRAYSHEDIIGIDIKENEYFRKFRYKNTDKSKYPKLLEIISNGELSLYIRIFGEGILSGMPLQKRLEKYVSEHHFVPPDSNGFFINYAYTEIDFQRYSYYIGVKGSYDVEHLYTRGLPFSKTFKKAMKSKFKNCPELIDKIEEKEFKKEDIITAIYFFNQECQ
jgi:hypothetical protein